MGNAKSWERTMCHQKRQPTIKRSIHINNRYQLITCNIKYLTYSHDYMIFETIYFRYLLLCSFMKQGIRIGTNYIDCLQNSYCLQQNMCLGVLPTCIRLIPCHGPALAHHMGIGKRKQEMGNRPKHVLYSGNKYLIGNQFNNPLFEYIFPYGKSQSQGNSQDGTFCIVIGIVNSVRI